MRDEPPKKSAREATKSHAGEKPLLAGYCTVPQMIPSPQMIPKMDRK